MCKKKLKCDSVNLVKTFKEKSDFANNKKNEVAAKDKKGEPVPCPDALRGIIKIHIRNGRGYVKWLKNYFDDSERDLKKPVGAKKSCIKRLVIVLESPHKDEYKNTNEGKGKKDNVDTNQEPNWAVVGPAAGTTGEKISCYLCSLLYHFIKKDDDDKTSENNVEVCHYDEDSYNGSYEVVLMNAVQFQCSLGISTTSPKDEKNGSNFNKNAVVSECLNEPLFQDCFVTRLQMYKPDIIINSCTGQEEGEIAGNQGNVQNLINAICKDNVLRLYSCHPSSLHYLKGFNKVTE